MLAVSPALTLTSAVSSCLYMLEPIRPATTRIIPKCTTYAAERGRLPVKARLMPAQRLLSGPAALGRVRRALRDDPCGRRPDRLQHVQARGDGAGQGQGRGDGEHRGLHPDLQ